MKIPREDQKPALVAFAKNPDAVAVKTRLAKDIGTDRARNLYLALLSDCLEQLVTVAGSEYYLACFPPAKDDFLRHIAETFGCQVVGQHGLDLGERMLNCLNMLLSEHPAVVIVGTDTPLLPVASLNEALFCDSSWDVVIGPTQDGGYWAFGARTPVREVFRGVVWGQNEVLTCTLSNCQELGLRVKMLDEAVDVDDKRSLEAVVELLKALPKSAPSTRRALSDMGLIVSAHPHTYIHDVDRELFLERLIKRLR